VLINAEIKLETQGCPTNNKPKPIDMGSLITHRRHHLVRSTEQTTVPSLCALPSLHPYPTISSCFNFSSLLDQLAKNIPYTRPAVPGREQLHALHMLMDKLDNYKYYCSNLTANQYYSSAKHMQKTRDYQQAGWKQIARITVCTLARITVV
jgi:hypothetical protein